MLEPGVRYRDERGREFVLGEQLEVTHKGTVNRYPARPERSVMGSYGRVVHHHLDDGRKVTYCTRLLDRLNDPQSV